MPGHRAQWSIGKPTPSVSADGTATLTAPLLDAGTKQGDLVFTMTADRALRVEWRGVPGVAGLSDFEAWSNA